MRVVSADWVVPVEGAPLERGAVAIDDDGRIAAVGPAAELGEGERFDGAVILPGFVDAHAHLEYAGYAGFGDGFPFPQWIGLHLERKRLLGPDDMRALARLGAASCLRSGITTVGDLSYSGAAAGACDELGLRAIVYLEVFGGADAVAERFEPMLESVGPFLSGRVRAGISPHAPYTCTLELYEACVALGLPVATHVAESEAEVAFVRGNGGPFEAFADLLVAPLGVTPVRALAGRGLLGPGVVAAHCVVVDDEEIGLLARHGAAVAHCPRSNALLGCGTAPVAALRAAGVTVCIATDSPASTPSFDMFDEMRAAVMAARSRERDAEALGCADALSLATLEGARALGIDAEVGSIAVGKHADLVVLSLVDSPFSPVEDPVNAAVLGGSPERVTATLVGGEDRYRKGSTAWRELTDAARRARSRMLR